MSILIGNVKGLLYMESTKRVAKLCLVDGGMQSHRDAGMQYDVIDM